MDDGAMNKCIIFGEKTKFEVGNTFCIEEHVYSRKL